MSTVLTYRQLVTAQDLSSLAGDDHVELVAGEIVPMSPPGGYRGNTSMSIATIVHVFVFERNLG
jgi:Uma2 family endonuclease